MSHNHTVNVRNIQNSTQDILMASKDDKSDVREQTQLLDSRLCTWAQDFKDLTRLTLQLTVAESQIKTWLVNSLLLLAP